MFLDKYSLFHGFLLNADVSAHCFVRPPSEASAWLPSALPEVAGSLSSLPRSFFGFQFGPRRQEEADRWHARPVCLVWRGSRGLNLPPDTLLNCALINLVSVGNRVGCDSLICSDLLLCSHTWALWG